MFSTTSPDVAVPGSVQTPLTLIVKQAMFLLVTRRERARSRSRLRWTLSQSSDRELGDIGLSRADIEDVVQGRH